MDSHYQLRLPYSQDTELAMDILKYGPSRLPGRRSPGVVRQGDQSAETEPRKILNALLSQSQVLRMGARRLATSSREVAWMIRRY